MLGCDIIEISRIRDSYERYGQQLLDRLLTPKEQQVFVKRSKSIAFLAGRFAAKEAVSKSYRTGIGRLAFTDIEILPDELGAPVVTVCGETLEGAELSISHSKDYAMAVFIHLA